MHIRDVKVIVNGTILELNDLQLAGIAAHYSNLPGRMYEDIGDKFRKSSVPILQGNMAFGDQSYCLTVDYAIQRDEPRIGMVGEHKQVAFS